MSDLSGKGNRLTDARPELRLYEGTEVNTVSATIVVVFRRGSSVTGLVQFAALSTNFGRPNSSVRHTSQHGTGLPLCSAIRSIAHAPTISFCAYLARFTSA